MTGAGLIVLALVAAATPAAADPAKPTNYKSRVLAVTPATPAISVKVVGGDGFLELTVDKGHRAVVYDYGFNGYGGANDGRPWLRIDADGTVLENQNSRATYLNANRYARNISLPAELEYDATARTITPSWKVVGHSGRYIWHDHRIHWMGTSNPPLVPGTRHVQLTARPDGQWTVPMQVDGHRVTVRGELILHPAPSPVPWLVLLVALVATVVLISLKLDAVTTATAAVVAGGAVGLVAGWEEHVVVPAAAGGNPLVVALPAAAVVVGAVAWLLRSRPTRVIAVLASAALTVGWALLRIDSLWKAVPLSDLSPAAAHALLAAAAGLAVGGALAGIRSGALAAPNPADNQGPGAPQPEGSPAGPTPTSQAPASTSSWRDPDLGKPR